MWLASAISELLIAMNPETAADDVRALNPGAVVVFDEPLKLEALRRRSGLLLGSF